MDYETLVFTKSGCVFARSHSVCVSATVTLPKKQPKTTGLSLRSVKDFCGKAFHRLLFIAMPSFDHFYNHPKTSQIFFFLRKFWVSLFLITVFFSSLSVLRFLFFVWSGCNITGFGLTIKIAKLASQLLLVAAPLFDRYYEHHKISRIAFVHFSHPKFLIFNG